MSMNASERMGNYLKNKSIGEITVDAVSTVICIGAAALLAKSFEDQAHVIFSRMSKGDRT